MKSKRSVENDIKEIERLMRELRKKGVTKFELRNPKTGEKISLDLDDPNPDQFVRKPDKPITIQ